VSIMDKLTPKKLEAGDIPVTAGQLRAWLTDIPDDAEIVMAKDVEGNGFSPLADVEPNARYVPDTPWSGWVPCSDAPDPDGMKRVVILWPTN
jgi:hypothetical protein